MLRFSAWILLASLALSQDLKPLFINRSGSALVYDLKASKTIAFWNQPRANTLPLRPGSVLKPFTLAAFIEAGLYKASLKAPEALAYSNNEFFDQLIARMEAADLERGYARFGLNYRAPTLTLNDLLNATKRLITRHREERLRPIFAGMEEAVSYGTARLAAIPATTVAGKTGTTSTSAVFIGYAPAAQPRYLLVLHLDSGSGGGDAAPYAAKIFSSLFATQPETFDPSKVSLRLFWQNPPTSLNLKPGNYPEGTLIDTGLTKLKSPGTLKVEFKDNRYLLTTQVPLEDYVSAVLHGEASGFKANASRQAMAIAARTYAAHFRRRHSEEGFDFCDTTHCQDARFTLNERKDLRDAVESTTSELLWFEGKTAATYYHADSGGWLESAGDAPYLKRRKDPWWQDQPDAHWTWSTSIAQLASTLNLSVIKPTFGVTSREPSGRARSLDVFGHPAEAAAFRLLVGRTIGWEKLPSRLFEVSLKQKAITFTGVGRGHGIGLPQTSAERMAAKAKTHVEILAEYYPGTRIGINASGLHWTSLKTPRITLFTTNPSRDNQVLAQAEKDLVALEALTGFNANPVIRIYPSREAFRDATGILDRVHGATRGRNVKLPPNSKPHTIRHELLHALLESNATASHPQWLREGLVQALLKEKSADADRASALIARQGLKQVLQSWHSSNSPF